MENLCFVLSKSSAPLSLVFIFRVTNAKIVNKLLNGNRQLNVSLECNIPTKGEKHRVIIALFHLFLSAE